MSATMSRVGVTRLLYVVGFLDLFGVSMIIPMMPKQLKELGASPTTIGLIGSLYGGLQLFSSPFVGKWSDLSGRSFVLISCLILSASGYALLGVASFEMSILLVVLGRIPAGIFKQSQDLCRMYLTDVYPAVERSKILGNFNAISSLGFIVGPIVGGHFADLPSGFLINAMITTSLFILSGAIVWLFVPEMTQIQGRSKVKSSSDDLTWHPLAFLKDFGKVDWTNLWGIFLVRFFLGFAVIVYRSNFSLMLDQKFELSGKMTGYLISYSGFVSTASGFMVGYIARLYNNNSRLTLHMSIVQFVTILALTFSPSLWLLVLCLTPLSVCNAVARVCMTNLTIEKGHNQDTGTLLGLGASVLSIARMLSPAIGGVAQEWHMAGPGVVGSVSAAVGVAFLLTLPSDTVTSWEVMEDKKIS